MCEPRISRESDYLIFGFLLYLPRDFELMISNKLMRRTPSDRSSAKSSVFSMRSFRNVLVHLQCKSTSMSTVNHQF